MKTLIAIVMLIATCAPFVAQTSDREEVKKLQKRINAEERVRRKEQRKKERAARNLRPTATISATAKKVRALIVQEMSDLGWTLAGTDDLTVSFRRPAADSNLVATKLGAAMGGHPDVKSMDDLVRFTTLDLNNAVTVTFDTGTVTRDTFKESTQLGPSKNGRFNLQMQELLNRVKNKAEAAASE